MLTTSTVNPTWQRPTLSTVSIRHYPPCQPVVVCHVSPSIRCCPLHRPVSSCTHCCPPCQPVAVNDIDLSTSTSNTCHMPNSGTICPQVSIILEALTVDSYYLKYIYFAVKPRQKDRSRLVTNRLRPRPVKTGLVTAKRPRPTIADRSLVVRSSLLRFLDL